MRLVDRSATVILTVALIGCSQPPDSANLDHSLGRARAHAATFRRMEAWVQQACSVADCRSDSLSLQEMLFAPVRNDQRVHAVWIEISTDPPVTMSLPSGHPIPNTDNWTRLMEPTLGWILVASERDCPHPIRSATDTRRTQCTWIARDSQARTRTSPHMIVAFVDTTD